MIARDTYKLYLSTAEMNLVLISLREHAENSDVRKPERDCTIALINSMKLDIRAQEAQDDNTRSD